ncbi:MAG: hypothetical protein M1609_09445 [Firmicutes bacterium]|nr:hypothetical protein [Bacillota bacterium]
MAFKCTKNIVVEPIGKERVLVKTSYDDNSYSIKLNSICEASTYELLYADIQVDRSPQNGINFNNLLRKVVGLSIKFNTDTQLRLIKVLGTENMLLTNLLLENGLVLENTQV